MNAAEISRGLGLHCAGSAYAGKCPSCGYRGFAVRDRDGVTLVKCHAGGCDQTTVLGALRQRGLWGVGTDASARPVQRREGRADNRDMQRVAEKLWHRSLSATGSVVEKYVRRRGHVGPIPMDVRRLPSAKHTESSTNWPTMIAAVRRFRCADLVAVHRTFLCPDGHDKAPVTPDKKTLGQCGGGAVWLADAREQLAVTEGIETGLAVMSAASVPTWAALSAGGIRKLILPALPLAASVTICADNDPVGIAAAHDAAERWHTEGRRVRIALPTELGTDFNDLVLAKVP